MGNKPYNVFQDVHAKIQAAKDNLRKANEARTDTSRKNAQEEALEKKFDRPAMNASSSAEEDEITQ
jgi:hypothetical protein